MSSTQVSIIELLRARTSSEHRALERTPLMARLMDKDLSMSDYAQVLLTFARFYATLDPLLVAATRESNILPASYQYQPRLPYLEADLSALRAILEQPLAWHPAVLLAPFAQPAEGTQRPHLTGEQVLGLIYVVEGSSQGGKIITPRLAKQLPLTNHEGLSFFHHFAFQAATWDRLRNLLSSIPADGIIHSQQAAITVESEPVCEAARAAFQALIALAKQPQNESAAV